MILIEDVKHACTECIRGHRSSQCKHHTRPLLQVRSKGRPNIRNNPNYRIAVFSKEIKPDDTNAKLIYVVRASMKYIIDFNTSDIIGPYDEVNGKKMEPSLKIDDNSFINRTSCCSQRLGNNQSCGCSGKPLNKSKILKKFLKKRNFTFVDNNDEAKQESIRQELNKSLQLSCTVPGTCGCDEDCNCEGCVEHNVPARSSAASPISVMGRINGAVTGNEASYSTSAPIPKLEDVEGFNQINDFNVFDFFNGSMADLQNALQIGPQNASLPTDNLQNSNMNNGNLQQFQLQSPQSSVEDEQEEQRCLCAANACNCTNCESHGIINGVKLEELFQNIDYKYFV